MRYIPNCTEILYIIKPGVQRVAYYIKINYTHMLVVKKFPRDKYQLGPQECKFWE